MKLAAQFKLPITTEILIQSHTPFLDHVDAYKGKAILALGAVGQAARTVAEKYGFGEVYTPSDLIVAVPHIWPFEEATMEYHRQHARTDKFAKDAEGKFIIPPISAILLFASPRDWGLDLQLIHDLLLSDSGVLGTRSPLNGNTSLPNNGYLQQNPPQLFFCNPDFDWATPYKLPRFAQGAFYAALKGVWADDKPAGTSLDSVVHMCGKPTDESYRYAEKRLLAMRTPHQAPLKRVWMIGDNPASDIQGAVNFKSQNGVAWGSVLVESGVYQKGTKPAFEPTFITPDVAAAIDRVLEAERFDAL
jgi:HAD superfamily hydrolase (TIGR01456 family)